MKTTKIRKVDKMDEEMLWMCRVCLGQSYVLHPLFSTRLQKVYEDLTGVPLIRDERRPVLACYICFARLKKCAVLKKQCLQSEKFFAEVLSRNGSERKFEETICSSNNLKITPVFQLSMGGLVEKAACAVKVEPPDTDAVVQEDPDSMLLDNMATERQQQYYVELEVVKTEPDDIATADTCNSENGSPEENTAESPSNLEPTQVNAKKSNWIRKKLIFIDDKKNKTTCDRKKVDTDRKLYQCKVCLIFYNAASSLTRHNRRFHLAKVPYPCNVCDKSYGSISHLNRHVRTVHGAKNQYQCNVCEKSYNSQDCLNGHIKVHSDEKPYQSNVCEKRYDNKPHLYKHVLKIEKPYECNVCLKRFSSRNSLQNHIYLLHARNRNSTDNNIKLFSCDVCKKRFFCKSSIVSHMRTHTGEKPYQCCVCKKSFSEKSTLNKHILVHGDDKPYQCDNCDKGFKRKHQLVTHIRLHTGEKPYQCNVCKLRFNQKIHLIDHSRTHTGERPFSCSMCSHSFSYKSCLTRHMSRAHKGIKK